MMLSEILVLDLERQYAFAGISGHKATTWGVLRHMFSPRFLPVVLCRLAHALCSRGWMLPARFVSALNVVFFGIEIAMRCEIGPGLCFPHTVGTVIGALRIGRDAVIYHGVTVGAKEMDVGYDSEARPIIGDNVVIGSGAKVLGGITVGNNVIIGANAVVVQSVPDNVVVGGVPAHILRHHSESTVV